MTAKNDIAGDVIATKKTTDAYRNNYELIFGKKSQTKNLENTNIKSNEEDIVKEKTTIKPK